MGGGRDGALLGGGGFGAAAFVVAEEGLGALEAEAEGFTDFAVVVAVALTAFADGVVVAFREVVVFGVLAGFELVAAFVEVVDFAFEDNAAACCRIGELVMFSGGGFSNCGGGEVGRGMWGRIGDAEGFEDVAASFWSILEFS